MKFLLNLFATMVLSTVAISAPVTTNTVPSATTTNSIKLDAASQSSTESDPAKLKIQAEKGDVEAQHRLGVIYTKGEGVTQDHTEAVKWFRLAAEKGYTDSQYCLSLRYAKGEGVDKDDKESAKWCRKAAEQGLDVAQYSLGVKYAKGEGVDQSFEEAVKWYRKAAEQGYPTAQYSLGLRYVNGEGVEKDLIEAYKWFSLSVAAINGSAIKARDNVERLMTDKEIAEAKHRVEAFEAKKQAANK